MVTWYYKEAKETVKTFVNHVVDTCARVLFSSIHHFQFDLPKCFKYFITNGIADMFDRLDNIYANQLPSLLWKVEKCLGQSQREGLNLFSNSMTQTISRQLICH